MDLRLLKENITVKEFSDVASNASLTMSCKTCLGINHSKSVLLHEKNEFVTFQTFTELTKAPFVIYGDFESLIPLSDNIHFFSNAKTCQIKCKFICINQRNSNLMELTSVKMLLKRKSKYCSKVFETQFIKHITLMKKNMKILKMFLNVGFLGR